MKRIINWVMCAAVFSAVGVLPGQDDAAEDEETSAETAAAELSAADQIKTMRERLEGVRKAYAELKEPRATLKSRMERNEEESKKRIKNMEEYMSKVAELDGKVRARYQEEYAFQVVPVEERTKYADEGGAKMKKAIALLSSKGKESDLIEGIVLFEQMRDSYQGIPRFKEASELFVRVLNRLERKWRNTKDRVERDRQKMSDSNRTKVLDMEESAFKRLEQKMQESGKSIDRDWFAPGSKYSGNLRVLERMIQKAKTSSQASANRPVEHAGEVPDMLARYWAVVDDAVAKMRSSDTEAATRLLDENEDYRTLTSLPRNCVPETLKSSLREQHQKLRSEMTTRAREVASLTRERDRAKVNFERELRNMERSLERLQEDITLAKDDEARRAAEEAERQAEEARRAEEERREAEAAEEDDDEEADEEEAPVEKPKKKKKSKKDA